MPVFYDHVKLPTRVLSRRVEVDKTEGREKQRKFKCGETGEDRQRDREREREKRGLVAVCIGT